MYGTGVVLVLNEKQSVRLYCLNLTCFIGDRYCMRSQSHFHALFKCIMYNNNGSLLIFIRWLNVWNGCRVGAGWLARTFVLLRVCLNWVVLLVIDTICMWLQSHRLIHYNDDDGLTLIFVHWTYEIGIVLALAEQYVRILLVFDTCYLWLMQYEVVISLWCAYIDLRLLNTWDGCRVGRLWTNSSYVHIAWIRRCCVIGVWCSMRS